MAEREKFGLFRGFQSCLYHVKVHGCNPILTILIWSDPVLSSLKITPKASGFSAL